MEKQIFIACPIKRGCVPAKECLTCTHNRGVNVVSGTMNCNFVPDEGGA